MISKVFSGSILGVDAYGVLVEVDINQGLPSFDIVGLPDSAVKESKERVRSCLINSEISFPIKRITINLAPANIKKEGPYFDLPIAVGILACLGIIDQSYLQDVFITGELSLDGSVRGVHGILSMVLYAKSKNFKTIILPYENKNEASIVEGIDVIGVKNISQLINHFNSTPITPTKIPKSHDCEDSLDYPLDFEDVRGQEIVKRALEISAAGCHNILIMGPPGSGKTMLAKRLPSIMPSLTFEESLEVTKIYSVAGLLKNNFELIKFAPFCDPHHSTSSAALIGGGRTPKPGQVTLAHNGVLFLDEILEFSKHVLESLRQPIEDKDVTISRVNYTIKYPCKFLLLASANPCPCGYYGSSGNCTCTQNEISKYLSRLSGPFLDRIDLQVESSFLKYDDLCRQRGSFESSNYIKNRVLKARQIQQNRYKDENISTNNELTPNLIDKYCKLGPAENNLVKEAFSTLNLSTRAYHKILKVSRTIADLAQDVDINCMHIGEAISYRNLDRKYWS